MRRTKYRKDAGRRVEPLSRPAAQVVEMSKGDKPRSRHDEQQDANEQAEVVAVAQGGGERVGRLIAVAWKLTSRLADDRLHACGRPPLVECAENLPKSKDIALHRRLALQKLLGCGVVERSDADWLSVDNRYAATVAHYRVGHHRAALLDKPEVDEDRLAVRASKDVPRLQVAVDVACGVKRMDRLGHPVHEARHFAARHRVWERLKILHHIVWRALPRAAPHEARERPKRKEAKRVGLGGKSRREPARTVDEKLERTVVAEADIRHAVDFGGKPATEICLDAPLVNDLAAHEQSAALLAKRLGPEPAFDARGSSVHDDFRRARKCAQPIQKTSITHDTANTFIHPQSMTRVNANAVQSPPPMIGSWRSCL